MRWSSAAQHVAITAPWLADTLFEFGADDRIVTQSGTATSEPDPQYAGKLRTVPVVGPQAPVTEPLLATRPDLVIVSYAYDVDPASGGASADQLRAAGAQLYYTRSACAPGLSSGPETTWTGVLADITNFGAILGVPSVGSGPARRTFAQDSI